MLLPVPRSRYPWKIRIRTGQYCLVERPERDPIHWYVSPSMGERQLYRLRARSDREVIREVEPGTVYVDRDTGEEFEVVGKLLPLAPSPSDLPWSVENLRLCGCSLEQLVPKDLNDCPHCGRRLPAVER